MKEFKIEGSVIRAYLENGKSYPISTAWVEKTMETLNADMEDVVLMWLEDNNKLVNEEQEELDKQASKEKVVISAKGKKSVVKTPKERTKKDNPTKELIISKIAEMLPNVSAENVNIENTSKLITFSINGVDFKIDLTQTRKKKD